VCSHFTSQEIYADDLPRIRLAATTGTLTTCWATSARREPQAAGPEIYKTSSLAETEPLGRTSI